MLLLRYTSGVILLRLNAILYSLGVLSMVVTSDNEVPGQFNIIFKPLPQFDNKHVVFGRVSIHSS